MYSSKWINFLSYFFSFIGLLLISVFYLQLSINITFSLILLSGGLVIYIGFKLNRHQHEREAIVNLAFFIIFAVFFYYFFYLLAQVTAFLYLITIFCCLILQDFTYRLFYYLQENSKLVLCEDDIEFIVYIIALSSIIISALFSFDFVNHDHLANTKVSDYFSNRPPLKSLTFTEWVHLNDYLQNEWGILKSFVSESVFGILAGITKRITLTLVGANIVTIFLRKFLNN